jgi:hypothetical protein
MAFIFSDRHLQEHQIHGYTVFRGIVPGSLVADLRRATDRARELARQAHGPQTQRLQPVGRYDLDLKPFRDYLELPELCDAVARLLSPRHTTGSVDTMGVLVEPAELAWCTKWHRDNRDNAPYMDVAAWEAAFHDRDLFNQSNCALYQDDSLWVVPGSHLRKDTARERELFPDRPIPGPDLEGKCAEEREAMGMAYARMLPGGAQVRLEAGDFCLYRNTLWHLGNYIPYCRRATLHDFVDTPEFVDWRRQRSEEERRRKEAGRRPWEWNAD